MLDLLIHSIVCSRGYLRIRLTLHFCPKYRDRDLEMFVEALLSFCRPCSLSSLKILVSVTEIGISIIFTT